MDRPKRRRRERERALAENLRNARGHDVGLFALQLLLGSLAAAFVIGLDELLDLPDGEPALDVLLCGVEQIPRRTQAVNRLKADGRCPVPALLSLLRLALANVPLKVRGPRPCVMLGIVGHITSLSAFRKGTKNMCPLYPCEKHVTRCSPAPASLASSKRFL